jgi:phosphoglycerate-specific signal transduction histidine kinase
MILRTILSLGNLLVLLFFPPQSFSVDVAPRITDREIVERLTRLEEGQKTLNQRIDEGFKAVNQRIDGVEKVLNQRLDETNRRIDELKQDLGQRIDELRQTLLWGSGITFAGMFSLVGFVLWDRRSVLTPAVRHMEDIREREEKLEAVLREYALKSPELAESLKKMGLL